MAVTLQIGRLQLGPPTTAVVEGIGDPVANIGGTIVSSPRTPLQFTLDVNTILNGAATLGGAQALRRQIRAALNNTRLKLECFLYVQYADDPEENGWYVPGPAQLQSPDNTAWKAVGLWSTSGMIWYLAGHRRSEREARSVWMKDLRTGLYERDYLGYILSTDFSQLPALQMSFMPFGATEVVDSVTGAVYPLLAKPNGRDGGNAQLVIGLPDLACPNFERAEAMMNLSDVIVFDRRGNLGPFGAGVVQGWDAAIGTASGLTYWWKLGEPSGTTATDSADTNTGTYQGGVTLGQTGIPGSPDTAALFNGSTGYVSTALQQPATLPGVWGGAPLGGGMIGGDTNLAITQPQGPMAVFAWFASTGAGHLVTYADTQTGAMATDGRKLYLGSDGSVYFGIVTAVGNVTVSSPGTYNDGNVHWALGYLTPTNAMQLYVDGQLVASNTNSRAPVALNGYWRLGDGIATGWANAHAFYAGTMGQAGVILGSTMTAAQIASLYSFGSQLSPTSYDTAAGLANPQAVYGWEEVMGSDYPWSWLNVGGTPDCPLAENGLVRVRYDGGSGFPGFRVDAWSGSSYVEQGKVVVQRLGDVSGYDNTWIAAGIEEYTVDRTVISCILANSADANSTERIYITVQRGSYGITFEAYPSLRANGTQADVILQWTPALNGTAADVNNSAVKLDSQGSGFPSSWVPGPAGSAVFVGTAGSGAGPGNSGQFASSLSTLGAGSFAASENWVSILRSPTAYDTISPFQHILLVVQAGAMAKYGGVSSAAYGVGTDTYQIASQNKMGYLQMQLSFAATQVQQILETEAMTLGTGTSVTADAGASGGSATTAVRTTDANAHCSRTNWPNGFFGTYRVFVRAKTSAGTLSIYARNTNSIGATVTTTSTNYVWLDLGEIVADTTTLVLRAWTSSGTLSVDRMEAHLMTDRVRTTAIYSGARDSAQGALYDSRTIGTLVAR